MMRELITECRGRRPAARLALLILGVLAAPAACGDSPTSQQDLAPAPAAMAIVSGNAQAALAATELPEPLVVRVLDGTGRPIEKQVVNFLVTSGGGSVYAGTTLTNADGLAQERWTLGPEAGTPQGLEARAVDTVSGEKLVFATFTASANAPAPVVASVNVTPATFNLEAGGTRQLRAEALDVDGDGVADATFSWSSSNTSVAAVNASGLVTAVAAGTATITAAAAGRSGSASVTVEDGATTDTTPPGDPGTPDLTLTPLSADSFAIAATWEAATDAAGYRWTTGANSGGFANEGEVPEAAATLHAPVLADSDGYWFCVAAFDAAGNESEGSTCQEYEAPATAPPVVASVAVTPASVSLAIGGTRQLAASALDAEGAAIGGRSFTWLSSNTAVATVSSGGLVTANAAGTATVTAATDGKRGASAVTVTAAAPIVASVEVTPSTAGLVVGQTRQLTATARAASGGAVGGKTFGWSSSNGAVASVSANGLVSARAAGSATITASVDGRSDASAITVTEPAPSGGLANECASAGPGWIWCDDFDQDRLGRYFEYDDANGDYVRAAGVGHEGSTGMRVSFGPGQVGAGSLKLAFGRTPTDYFAPVDAGTTDYREIYLRFYFRNADNWRGGGGDKMARAISFARSDWSEAMIAHIWSGNSGSEINHLLIEPASGTDAQGNLQTSGYNDFANLRWVGSQSSNTPIFDSAHVGEWHCVESRVRLNDAGQSNGVFELWIDGTSEARSAGLNWVGAFDNYGINSVFLENYWNSGSPQQQERYFDNMVVSTQRIGCGG